MAQKLEGRVHQINKPIEARRGFNYLMGSIMAVGGMFIPFIQYCLKSDDYAHSVEYFIKSDPWFLYAGLITSGIGAIALAQDKFKRKKK
jgi:hypothetical protein